MYTVLLPFDSLHSLIFIKSSFNDILFFKDHVISIKYSLHWGSKRDHGWYIAAYSNTPNRPRIVLKLLDNDEKNISNADNPVA